MTERRPSDGALDRRAGARRAPEVRTSRTDPPPVDARATFAAAVASARRYADGRYSEATRLAYDRDWRAFESWCAAIGARAVPAEPVTVAAFIAAGADRGLAASTLARRLAALRLIHLASEHPSPHDALVVRQVLAGVRASQRERPSGAKAALVDDDVARLVDVLDARSLAGARDRALLLVGFAGALRRSELVGIDVAHLEQRPDGLLLTIPWSKTDREGAGETVALPALPASAYCPVRALDAWLERAGIASGPVFRRLKRGPAVSDRQLAAGSVAAIVKRCAAAAGHADVARFGGHSLRRGFITSAARAGADPFRIAAQSRHRSLETVRRYVEAETRFENHPGAGLFGTRRRG